MAMVREILQKKGSQVWSIGTGATVLQAALLMNEHHIGGLVVIDQGRVAGMITSATCSGSWPSAATRRPRPSAK